MKNMPHMTHLHLSVICACLLTLFTATAAHAKDYKLFGKVLYANSQPASEISIVAMTTDSLIKNHQLSGEKGNFAWIGLPPRQYIFSIRVKGYQPVSMLIDWQNNRHIDLGTITLMPYGSEREVELPEVAIQGSSIIQKVDKMIVFPQAQQVKMSAGSMDLLHMLHLPGMDVNTIEQRVSIDGQAPVYQINGRPQSREQILGLKPENIARIEYSNNPSIRYASRNVGGIINFILKERQTGGSVYTNLLASPMTGFLNGTVSNTFNYKKSEFSLLYNNSWRDYTKRRTDRFETFNNGSESIERTSKGLNSPFGYLSQDINLGYTLQIDENNMFSATLMNYFGRQHTSINAQIEQKAPPKENVEFMRESKAVFKSYSPSLDLFFLHKFKNNQSLELNLVGTLSSGDYERTLRDEHTGKHTVSISNNVDNSRSSLIAEALYRKQFKTQQLGLGIKHIQSYTKNEYSGTSEVTTKMTSGNSYLYGEWSGRIKKLSYSLGTGMKLYHVNNKSESRDYVRNITTVNLMYPLHKSVKVNYLFQFTPSFPTLSQLSDIEQIYENILTIRGNAHLKTYTTIRNRFLFTYNPSQKLRANLWLSHTKAFNPISLYTFYEDNRFISEYQNQNYNQQINAQLDVNLSKLFDCVNLSMKGGWNRYSSSGSNYRHYLYNLYWSASMQAYHKNWNISCAYTYPQKSLSGELVNTRENYLTVLLGYRVKKLYLTGGVYYPFISSWKIENASLSAANPFQESIRIKDNGNMLVIGISYQFGYGKSLKKSRKNLNNADNETGILKVQE